MRTSVDTAINGIDPIAQNIFAGKDRLSVINSTGNVSDKSITNTAIDISDFNGNKLIITPSTHELNIIECGR